MEYATDPSVSCCFTGHRDIPWKHARRLLQMLPLEIISLYQKGYRNFLTGGALGFDTMVARILIRLRQKQCPQLRLIVVQPCDDQDSKWSTENKRLYRDILAAADEVICLSPTYFRGCMLSRNRVMVDKSSCCIAYLTHTGSGTAYTANYAAQHDCTVINLADRF